MTYEVRLDVYEGPFDVLLTLISERRVDVCDVSIARLTEDYLARLEQMRDMDLEVTTEFLVVAATLLQLKARALLPVAVAEELQAVEDMERDVLIARLLEVRTFQGVGNLLGDWLSDGDRWFPAAPAPDDPALRVLPTLAGIRAADLGSSLADMLLDKARPVDTSSLLSDEVSAEQAVELLLGRMAGGATSFRELVQGLSLTWAIALFLAILELCMRGELILGQAERLGDIRVEAGPEPRRDRGA